MESLERRPYSYSIMVVFDPGWHCMKTKSIKVENEHGLHLRVAGMIAKLTTEQQCAVTVKCGQCRQADGCSVLQLLTLGATKGTSLDVTVDGANEDAVLDRMSEFFMDGSGI